VPGANLTAGFFGKIPAAGDFVAWNLPRAFTDRWDRWMSTDLADHPARGPLDPRAWRFTVPAGIFCDQPAAGVWRMSEDRAGRRYPFVIARIGPPPDPGDPWFDRVGEATAGAVSSLWLPDAIAGRLARLPEPAAATTGESRMLFWLDDWEVHELAFADIHDLAANGLRAMRTPRPETEEL
jgi:type VI secretion system protein ImpM